MYILKNNVCKHIFLFLFFLTLKVYVCKQVCLETCNITRIYNLTTTANINNIILFLNLGLVEPTFAQIKKKIILKSESEKRKYGAWENR